MTASGLPTMLLTIRASAISAAFSGIAPKKAIAVICRCNQLDSERGRRFHIMKGAGGADTPRSSYVALDLDNLAVAVKVYRRL